MKILKIVFLLVMLCLCKAYAQTDTPLKPLTLDRIDDLRYYFSQYYKVKSSFEMDSCFKSTVFVKFTVLNNGSVDSLEFSNGTPPQIKQALKSTILATSGAWEKAKNNKIFLLPVSCYYEGGCTPGLVETAPQKKSDLTTVLKQAEKNNESAKPVSGILEFELGKYKTLNCTIIHPFSVGVLQ